MISQLPATQFKQNITLSSKCTEKIVKTFAAVQKKSRCELNGSHVSE